MEYFPKCFTNIFQHSLESRPERVPKISGGRHPQAGERRRLCKKKDHPSPNTAKHFQHSNIFPNCSLFSGYERPYLKIDLKFNYWLRWQFATFSSAKCGEGLFQVTVGTKIRIRENYWLGSSSFSSFSSTIADWFPSVCLAWFSSGFPLSQSKWILQAPNSCRQCEIKSYCPHQQEPWYCAQVGATGLS